MTVHTHSNIDPVWTGLLFPTDRLSFNFAQGEDFTYSSRPCSLPAPFNELGLDFSPNYPGVDDDADGTAAVRHRVEGTVTEVKGDRGTIEGTITSVLCVTEDGKRVESENVIVTHFVAKYRRASDNELALTGQFRISPTLSTGTFAGLEGHGSTGRASPAWPTFATCLSPPAQRAATSPISSASAAIRRRVRGRSNRVWWAASGIPPPPCNTADLSRPCLRWPVLLGRPPGRATADAFERTTDGFLVSTSPGVGGARFASSCLR